MIARMKFEFFRLFSWRNIIILTVLLLCTLLFIGNGISEYKNQLKMEKNFRITEQKKIKNFTSYEQYASHGFKVWFRPSPLIIFLRKFDFVHYIEAKIDSFGDLNIYNKMKGRNSFGYSESIGSLGFILFLFYTLFFIYIGAITFRHRQKTLMADNWAFIKTILSRLLLLNIIFILFLFVSYLFALSMGMIFIFRETIIFGCFALFSTIFLDFFFFSGVVFSALFKYKKKALMNLPAVWFIFVFIVPLITETTISKDASYLPSTDDLDLQKHITLFSVEKKAVEYIGKIMEQNKKAGQKDLKNILIKMGADFVKTGYRENKRLEIEYHARVEKLIEGIERVSYLIPTDFFRFMSFEMSSKGYREYLNFINYVLDLEQDFLEFYFDKRLNSNKKEIENFIKNDENVYKAQSRLPRNFWKGTALLVVYTVLLFLVFLRVNRKKKEKIEKLGFPLPDPKRFLFLLADPGKKEELIKELSQGDDAVVMEKLPEEAFNEDISLKRFLDYICREQKLNEKELKIYLENMAIKKEDLKKRLSSLSPESIQKITCCIDFAREKGTLVIDDFVRGSSYDLERRFLALLNYYVSKGKKAVYVSDKVFLPAATNKLYEVGKDGYRPYILDAKKITLR